MFEDHQLIRRAAVQAFCNLCISPIQVKRCEGKNDKVKYAVLLCGDDEDVEVVKAASGGLAMLTAQSKKCCEKVFDVSWIFTYSYRVKKLMHLFNLLSKLKLFVGSI